MQSSLLLIVYASFWQVLIQVIYGTLDVDPVAAETAHQLPADPVAARPVRGVADRLLPP
ncbi:MAG: hypothetical protein R2717_06065 [Schumannella sp.]